MLLMTSLLGGIAMAQIDLPPNAMPGKCYAKCLKPAQFTAQMQSFVSKASSKKLVVNPAELGSE